MDRHPCFNYIYTCVYIYICIHAYIFIYIYYSVGVHPGSEASSLKGAHLVFVHQACFSLGSKWLCCGIQKETKFVGSLLWKHSTSFDRFALPHVASSAAGAAACGARAREMWEVEAGPSFAFRVGIAFQVACQTRQPPLKHAVSTSSFGIV